MHTARFLEFDRFSSLSMKGLINCFQLNQINNWFGFRFRFSFLLSYLHHVERTGVNVGKVISLVKIAVNFYKISVKRENPTRFLFLFKFLVGLCGNILLFFGNMTEILFIQKTVLVSEIEVNLLSTDYWSFQSVKNFYGTYKCMCCNSQVAFHSTINFVLVIVLVLPFENATFLMR